MIELLWVLKENRKYFIPLALLPMALISSSLAWFGVGLVFSYLLYKIDKLIIKIENSDCWY